MNKCTSIAGHFDGHAEALKQFMWHHRMDDVRCPGPYRKPLDAAIGRLLAPHCSRGCQGDSKQTTINKYTHFAGRFDGHHDAVVQYRAHCSMEEVQGFTRSHWMPPSGEHLLRWGRLYGTKMEANAFNFTLFFLVRFSFFPV